MKLTEICLHRESLIKNVGYAPDVLPYNCQIKIYPFIFMWLNTTSWDIRLFNLMCIFITQKRNHFQYQKSKACLFHIHIFSYTLYLLKLKINWNIQKEEKQKTPKFNFIKIEYKKWHLIEKKWVTKFIILNFITIYKHSISDGGKTTVSYSFNG